MTQTSKRYGRGATPLCPATIRRDVSATLPPEFKTRMRALLGGEAEALFRALQGPPHLGLRVNTLKTVPERFAALSPWPLERLPWCGSGYRLSAPAGTPRPGLHPLHRAGVYYLQEPSAMAVAEAVAPTPGAWVLDLAAAPGGKATHLGALLGGSGLLVANEAVSGRVRALGENLERCGVPNALLVSETVERLAARWRGLFDYVLLDAPCSGEGMFRKSDDARAMWSAATVARCAQRQRALLDAAAALVKPGGVLVYSTCTFAPEENEGVVATFLRAHPEFTLSPLTLPGAAPGRPDWAADGAELSLERAARFWPHRTPGEGHFVARLERARAETSTPGARSVRRPPALPHPIRNAWAAFCRETFRLSEPPFADRALELQGDRLVALPAATPELRGLRVLRSGLWLGTPKKGRFEPSHSLALALPPKAVAAARRLELAPDDPQLERYGRGEVLESAGDDGWLLVTTLGFVLGWGRRVKGTVKNFYPRGLRL
jgi:NOL1/NOP2/sun family putative RNA methylase